MSQEHLVVDGSNIATEGRTAPSLAQLNDAVTEFVREHPFTNVVVIVDATFPNRIDESERAEYEEALLAGELLTPPAGAVGRGDAFVLQIAERTGATILSNDSFQEFHATYSWLFEDDRLWGGKPVPGVGLQAAGLLDGRFVSSGTGGLGRRSLAQQAGQQEDRDLGEGCAHGGSGQKE